MNMGFVPVLVRCEILTEMERMNEKSEVFDTENFINDVLQKWIDSNYQGEKKQESLGFNEAAQRWLMSQSIGGI